MKNKSSNPDIPPVSTDSDNIQSAPTTDGRRRVLQVFAGGAAFGLSAPERWSKPVVNAMVLPAHGQMSPVSCATTDPELVEFETIGDSERQTQAVFQVVNSSGSSFDVTALDLDTTPSVEGLEVDIDPPLPITVPAGGSEEVTVTIGNSSFNPSEPECTTSGDELPNFTGTMTLTLSGSGCDGELEVDISGSCVYVIN